MTVFPGKAVKRHSLNGNLLVGNRNYSFEDVNLFNFETDNLNVNDVIK